MVICLMVWFSMWSGLCILVICFICWFLCWIVGLIGFVVGLVFSIGCCCSIWSIRLRMWLILFCSLRLWWLMRYVVVVVMVLCVVIFIRLRFVILMVCCIVMMVIGLKVCLCLLKWWKVNWRLFIGWWCVLYCWRLCCVRLRLLFDIILFIGYVVMKIMIVIDVWEL